MHPTLLAAYSYGLSELEFSCRLKQALCAESVVRRALSHSSVGHSVSHWPHTVDSHIALLGAGSHALSHTGLSYCSVGHWVSRLSHHACRFDEIKGTQALTLMLRFSLTFLHTGISHAGPLGTGHTTSPLHHLRREHCQLRHASPAPCSCSSTAT